MLLISIPAIIVDRYLVQKEVPIRDRARQSFSWAITQMWPPGSVKLVMRTPCADRDVVAVTRF